MKELEEDNLKQRGWDLSGEVTAEERGKNELLEKFIDVDYRAQTGLQFSLM
jgi:U3 small nucleolar ribonucleoprotein component